jgi:hypothetical protein
MSPIKMLGRLHVEALQDGLFQHVCSRNSIHIIKECLEHLDRGMFERTPDEPTEVEYGSVMVGDLYPKLHRADPKGEYRFVLDKPSVSYGVIEEILRLSVDDDAKLRRDIEALLLQENQSSESVAVEKVTTQMVADKVEELGWRPLSHLEALSLILAIEFPSTDTGVGESGIVAETDAWRRILHKPIMTFGKYPKLLCFGRDQTGKKAIGLNDARPNFAWTNAETFICVRDVA